MSDPDMDDATAAASPADNAELERLRREIDSADADILNALNRRALCSLAIGDLKARSGAPVYRPAREESLLQRLAAANPGPLPEEHLRSVYREIMSSSRALQQPTAVACLGPEGTFSHMACLECFGHGFVATLKPDLADIFTAVLDGECQLGLVPLENSAHGTVVQSLDLFASHAVHVRAEHVSRIRLSLLSTATSLADVRVVYSHSQALGQSASWLRKYLPAARQIAVESTAAAARLAAGEPGAASVGHAGIATQLGLALLASDIQDLANNSTRFFIIGPYPLNELDADRSSVLFALADKPGSLAAALNILAGAGLNLSKLESRPLRGESWKYIFFADLEGDITAPKHAATLARLRDHCPRLRVLGSYVAKT